MTKLVTDKDDDDDEKESKSENVTQYTQQAPVVGQDAQQAQQPQGGMYSTQSEPITFPKVEPYHAPVNDTLPSFGENILPSSNTNTQTEQKVVSVEKLD